MQIILILDILLAFYLGSLIWLIIGWVKVSSPKLIKSNSIEHLNTRVSVIIPFFNERENIEDHIEHTIAELGNQENCELIFVDDGSSDGSATIIKEAITKYSNITLVKNKFNKGKKGALKTGVEASKGEVIITSDIDIHRKEFNINFIRNKFQKSEIQLLIMPVDFEGGKSFIEQFQQLENLSLTGVTHGSAGNNMSLLCSGANLAYRKSAFEEVDGFEGNLDIQSGDDVYLLYKIKEKFGNSAVSSTLNKGVLAITKPKKRLKDFVNQRKRWTGKTPFLKNPSVILMAFIVYLTNLMTLFVFIKSLIYWDFTLYSAFPLIIKFAADFYFLFLVALYFGKTRLLKLFLLAELFYLVYVTFVPLFGFITLMIGNRKRGISW